MRLSTFGFLLVVLLSFSACLSTQAPAPIARYGVGQGAGSVGIHTVLQGDTLYTISKRYNIASRDIAVVNHLQAPFYLPPGLRLTLPPPQQYTVRPGDNLNTVSRLFRVSRSEIAQMNDITAPYFLRPGRVLRLPSVTQKSEPQVFAQAAPVEEVVATPLPGNVTMEVLSPPGEKPVQTAMQDTIVQPPRAKPKSPISAKIPERSSKKFLRPVKGSIISPYGPKKDGLFNDGINISAPRDVPVRAAENGVVVYAGNELKGSGNLILIRHADRWMTAYAHMGNIQIKKGDVVKRGQAIGTVGSTGGVDRPQLHFEVRRGTEAINPEIYTEG